MGGRQQRTAPGAGLGHHALAAQRPDQVTPAPVQDRLPIWLGYQGPKGARRAGRMGEGLLTIAATSWPHYRDGLQWFSPDLKQRPTALSFSRAGVAEITLPKGKLTLTRDGDKCKTGRE